MSPQENDELDIRVKLSGLTKQEYLINRALEKEIVVNGNPKVYIALKKSLEQVLNELRAIGNNYPSNELLETINLINQTLCGMKCNEPNGQIMIVKSETGNYHITNLGAILFAKKLSDFPSLERKAIRVIKYEGNDRISSASKEQVGVKGYAPNNSSMVSRLLKDTCESGFIKISEDSTSDKNRKYLPFWA